MVLADPRRHVAVLSQHLADGAATSRQDAGVAVVAGRGLGDARERRRVVVAAGDQGGAGGAAQRGRVKLVVAQALGRKSVHRRRRNAAAERAVLAETAIVDQEQNDVRRTLRRADHLRKLRRIGVEVCPADLAGEAEIGPRQNGRRSAFADRCIGIRFLRHGYRPPT